MGNDWFKKNLGWIILGVIGIIVLIPLGIAFMLSFRFIITDTTNEWIGFWGGYLGAILGGLITLYVMWKTNEEARKNLEETLKHEKEIEKRKENQDFSNLLIEKLANWAENIDDMITQSAVYAAFREKLQEKEEKSDSEINQEREYMLAFSKQVLNIKSINYELYLHFGIKKDQIDFVPNLAEELQELFGQMHDEIKDYYDEVLKGKYTSDEVIHSMEKFNVMISNVVSKANMYIKNILKE